MSNGDESMSPAEFAKLMGAYPEPSGNPLPAYGGYMDNSAANFAWVNNNDYFGAEGQNLKCDLCGLSKHKKIENQWGQTFYYCTNDEPNEYSDGCVWGDRAEGKWLMDDGMHYNGVVIGIDTPDNAYLENNCPQCGASFVVSDSKNIDHCDGCVSDWDADTDLTPTNHMNNSIGQVVPITNPMELPTNLIETEAGGGPEGQITPDVFSAEHWSQENDASYLGDRQDLYSVRLNGKVIRDLTLEQVTALTELGAESSDVKDRKCVNCKTTDALNFGQGSSYAESRECMWCWAGQPPESSGGLCQWCFDGVMMDAGEKDGWRHWVCSRTDCESHKYHAETFEARTGFVFPDRKAWPIGDREHAELAIDYMEEGKGNPAEYPKIEAAIEKKYGDLDQFEATEWWNRQSATGHEKASGEHGGFYIPYDYSRKMVQEIFKNWKKKPYPYEKRITQDSFGDYCESCGEIEDKDNYVHYQFYLPQSNSRRHRMRHVSGGYCTNDSKCGSDLCESCIESSGNECEECGEVMCSGCARDSQYHTGDRLCDECLPEEYQAESFEAPYAGAGAIMGIAKDTPLEQFTDDELTKSSAIHGDFNQASLDYSGHQNIEVRAEGTGRPYWIKKVKFQGNSQAANESGDSDLFYPHKGIFTSAAAANRDLQEMLEIAKKLPEVRIYIGNEYYSDYQQPIADASYRWRVLHEGTKHHTTHHGFSVYLPYAHYNIDYQVITKLGAEMDIVADGMAVVSNIRDDLVGVVEVIDDKDDDEMVEISIQDENMDEIGSFTLDDGHIMDDYDDYLAESKTPSLLTLGIGAVAAILAFPYLKEGVNNVFGADNEVQEILENEPEIIESPDTGDLDPAAYEELVVESTGYAVDIIPMGLDGSFMGSRFAALPTERYVDYNDPGIGAHTDVALNRDEMFLEPEMAMVQAAEGDTVVKETQAPGQSPYFQMGHEPLDMNYRVIKETHPVSLDPAVKPFIPQSMTGYTGNKNTPPSVYNKMFNIGVLGQTPAFVPGQSDIGANHFGSRDAKPDMLGLGGSVGGPLSDQVNLSYTDGTTSMSLAQWAIENTVSQSSDTEAVVIDRSSGAMKRIRRV